MPIRGDPDPLYIGRTLDTPSGDLKDALRRVTAERFDFIAIPLAAPGGQGRGAEMQPSVDSDLVLDSSVWHTSVIGAASESLVPDTAQNPAEAAARCAALETELRWAGHLALRAVLLPPPAAASGGLSYARAVSEFLRAGVFPEASAEDGVAPPGPALRVPAGKGGWAEWNRFRTICGHHQRLWAALEFTEGGSADLTERDVDRWAGEPVRFAIVPAAAFVANKQGFPVLPKLYKALLLRLFRHQVQVILSAPQGGVCQESADSATGEGSSTDVLGPRLQYVARLFQSLPELNSVERFSQSHLDCLQAPLQPLQDNLESETYELFETDPVKYAQYEEAVLAFLRERLSAGRAPPFAVMVLGAGRGPLVAAALRAAARAETPVSVWAVEKNPNAVHTLRHRRRKEAAWSCVEVVAGDMRSWQAPRKADVIISELLGSFGDNELSPECLDGAQRFLAEDGVCIPQNYTSSLQPISAAALWADARGRNGGVEASGESSLDMGYVVQLHRAFYPTSGPKDCFTFKHPNWALESNDRYGEFSFEAETDALVHGFAGYFDCELYGSARISIHPSTASEGMFSWFPMFFPLQTPVFLRRGDAIRLHMWRLHDEKKAWYEWALSEPMATPIQNPGGKSYPIGLF
uniref:Protein arginine N-methyltransferase n=1 Tax=Alexandrium monilatum TaxID=311494 RepID=A0A7S4S6V8_9DINO